MQPMGDYFEENIDTSITVPPPILSCVATRIPQSAALAHSTKVPLGAVIRPMAPGEECSVVQPGPAGIVRCKRYDYGRILPFRCQDSISHSLILS